MQSTEELIETLAANTQNHAQPPVKPLIIYAQWLAVMLGSFAAILWLYGLRADWAMRVKELDFMLEITLSAALILIAGGSAISLGFPDHPSYRRLSWALIAVLVAYTSTFCVICFHETFAVPETAPDASHHLACLLCILSFAAIPALWMVWRLRHLASTHPVMAGGIAALMAMAIGNLGVRLVETELTSSGLFLWHYLPLLILTGIGLLLGRSLLKW